MNNKTSRKKDIDELLSKINFQYLCIERLYHLSLDKKEIDSNLKIEVKSFLENARSSLDYCAHDIAETYQIKPKRGTIYFPIVAKSDDFKKFEDNIKNHLTDLQSKNTILFYLLESVQPYHSNFAWLGDFATIVVDNKHVRLTPQIKKETPSLTIENSISIYGNSSISVGLGDCILIGNKDIRGGQVISSNTKKILSDSGLVCKREIWIDFKFNGEISVLCLMNKIRNEIPKIIEDIYKLL